MVAAVACFECLQRSIESDFSSDLLFRHGISDSALPFGCSAVVQIDLPGEAPNVGSEGLSTLFVLTRLIDDEQSDCNSLHSDEGSISICKAQMTSPEESCGRQGESDVGTFHGAAFSSLENDSISSLSCSRGLVEINSENPTRNSLERFSLLEMITTLSPVASVSKGSYSAIKDIVEEYTSCSTEHFLMLSLSCLVEGKMAGQYGSCFLNLVGCPAFSRSDAPKYVRHPNISPILGILKMPGYSYLLHPKVPYSLEDILHYSPKALGSEWHIRFLIYQMLSALHHIHSVGIAHGNMRPSSIKLTGSCWVWLEMDDMHLTRDCLSAKDPWFSSSYAYCCIEDCPCQTIYADQKFLMSLDWHSHFMQWWAGELSNYEYLLVLNKLAGRRWGDHTFHTVMPWVIDFSVKPDENSDVGWRDLTKSKWRLAKGDEQLDFTYSTSDVPHHVSDECLSELAVCSYKARRLPLWILRSAVRSVYEPNEYPSNMQRLYQWTPDECIPEFYSDPRIFVSVHPGMTNLAVPAWATSPEEFISLHRNALESERVSKSIHHWIDLTFGHKLSGQPSIEAKNVMLPVSDPLKPRTMGRRQLFTKPHPMRQGITRCSYKSNGSTTSNSGDPSEIVSKDQSAFRTGILKNLEEANLFCHHASYLSPIYSYNENIVETFSSLELLKEAHLKIDTSQRPNCNISLPPTDLNSLIEYLEADDTGAMSFQEFLSWKERSSYSGVSSENLAEDIFSVGCIIAEVYLKRPLFDPVSIIAYKETGVLPGLILELPPHVVLLVEACVQRDWKRRPSAKCLLDSQYFPPTVRSAYLFLSPLQIIGKSASRLKYAADLASKGALKVMGSYAAEICVPYCLDLFNSASSDVESESTLCLLKEFLKCLGSQATIALILPTIQKILQASENSHLKVSLLQDSFLQDLWQQLGKQIYLEKVHPLLVSNLLSSNTKNYASAASVALIGSCEEHGIPITIHQTIMPLIQSFGRRLCVDAVDTLVRIGGLLGERFIIRHLLPLLRNIVLSCFDISYVGKSEPIQSLRSLALVDSLSTLDGLLSFLTVQMVVKELIQDYGFLQVRILMQNHMDLNVIQAAAKSLIIVCQRIGQDLTVSQVMPRLKGLFEELVFSQGAISRPSSGGRNLKLSTSKLEKNVYVENQMDLVFLLYPSLAALIGIEKLRQCCPTWFLLEQMLERFYDWQVGHASFECSRSQSCDMLESLGESSTGGVEVMNSKRFILPRNHSSEYIPAKLLLNGVGWSIPQSQVVRSGMDLMTSKQGDEPLDTGTSDFGNQDPWFWFPTPASTSNGPDFLGRMGSLKDELPWKIKATILHSARAHPGVLRSLAVCHDECTFYTGGVGPGFKGSVQQWDLSRMNCVSSYYGHDEVVNALCVLSTSGRVASCDGTIHVWNGQTGKLVVVHTEPSTNSSHTAKANTDQTNMLTPNILSGGILSNALNGSLYTCMHHLDFDYRLVAGIGNGSVRFIDLVQDQKLHIWKTDPAEASFSSLVSSICSCGSEKLHARSAPSFPSWIAAGLSSGHCRLLDARSGSITAHWRAHDGYITKLAAPEDHLLVSSSLDKTLRVWDLRRNPAPQSYVFRGHSDGISSFSIWGQDIISVSRNKIGLTSLSRMAAEGVQRRLSPQTLYSADRGTKNLSVLSTVSVLPFSRLFLVGTEDGYVKICC